MSSIGILAIQGAAAEHAAAIERCNARAIFVRNFDDLKNLNGIIFPGGESTAIGRFLQRDKKFRDEIISAIKKGLPVFGTCAGAILLAKKGSDFSLKILNAEIERNAFGSQISSFLTEIKIAKIAEKFPAIFIRAPKFKKIGNGVEILAKFKNEPIFVREKNIFAASFHPEISSDDRVHKFFVEVCATRKFRF